MDKPTQYISKYYYEVFEYHNLPRGLKGLTLRINKPKASQYLKGYGHKRIPIGSLAFVISESEEIPEFANFVNHIPIGFNSSKLTTTKAFHKIHDHIDYVKQALKHPNLGVYINGKEIPVYVQGSMYEGRGIYQGIFEDEKGKYYYFSKGTMNYKEYIQ